MIRVILGTGNMGSVPNIPNILIDLDLLLLHLCCASLDEFRQSETSFSDYRKMVLVERLPETRLAFYVGERGLM